MFANKNFKFIDKNTILFGIRLNVKLNQLNKLNISGNIKENFLYLIEEKCLLV